MRLFNKALKELIELLLFLILISISDTAFTQNFNNIWIFGEHGGINFNYNPPVGIKNAPVSTYNGIDPLSSKNPYVNYTSSICDSSGNLLFYTDGISVWNNKNSKLRRYLSRWPWADYCSPLIVPHPENDSLYYIFGVSSGGPFANKFQYLDINIKSNDGNGEIVYPEPSAATNYFTVLKDSCAVVVAGTSHCNRKDTWIITYSQNAFYTYLVTKDGVSSNAIKTLTPDINNAFNQHRNMKFSASGEKLVMPLINANQVIVFDFDNLTGKFSKPVKLHMPENLILEDVEVSPDGSKLYLGAYTPPDPEIDGAGELHNIYQMDLNAGTTTAIQNSLTLITPFADRANCVRTCFIVNRTMQLAPDGKIYVSMRYFTSPSNIMFDPTLSVVTAPNEKGNSVNYIKDGLNIESKYNYIAYNYIRSNAFTPNKNAIQFKQNSCSDVPINFSLIFNQIDSVKWNFGDPSSGALNFSGLNAPQHLYSNPGTYAVKAMIYTKCFVDSCFDTVTVVTTKKVQISSNITNQVVCKNFVFTVDASAPSAEKYLWSTGNQQPVQTIIRADSYTVLATNSCSSDQRTFAVTYNTCDCNIYIPNAFTPNHDGLNDVFRPSIKCYPKDYSFIIYNRFGQIVYRTSEINKGWDGKINSYDASMGAYIWLVHYRDPNDYSIQKKQGTFILVK
jgi:gliding motility-associated-like protein